MATNTKLENDLCRLSELFDAIRLEHGANVDALFDEIRERASASIENPPPGWRGAALPNAIWKATRDEFQYAIGLRSGLVIEFVSAQVIRDEWLLLDEPKVLNSPCEGRFDRGLEVRISEIEWACDAPHGS